MTALFFKENVASVINQHYFKADLMSVNMRPIKNLRAKYKSMQNSKVCNAEGLENTINL